MKTDFTMEGGRVRSGGVLPLSFPGRVQVPAGLSFLLFFGWAVQLLYFPSGLLHNWLGPKVYARDVLLLVHLAVTFTWLGSIGQLPRAMRGMVPLGLPLLFLLPGLVYSWSIPGTITYVKWFFQWFDCFMIGYLLAMRGGSGVAIRIFVFLTLVVLTAEYAAGFYEWSTNSFYLSVKTTAKTAMGVGLVMEENIGGHIRIRGLQRDVFCFASVMALGCIGSLCVTCLSRRNFWLRICGIAGTAAFGWMLFVCGGRSAFAGILAAGILAVVILVHPDVPRRFLNAYIAVVLGGALFVSWNGVGAPTAAISSALLSESHIGDTESAFIRDQQWRETFYEIDQHQPVLIAGAPLIALFAPKITPVLDIVDNQFLWCVYHFGIIGSIAFVLFFWRCLRMWTAGAARAAHLVLVMFLIELIGEGIARESIFFLSSIPAFAACGFLWGSSEAVLPQKSRR